MGGPMSGHLARAGSDLIVWNRSPEKLAQLTDLGVPAARSLKELGAACEAVFLCVRASADVEACALQTAEGYRQAGRGDGLLIVDHSTILPSAAIDIGRKLGEFGVRFVDAPITGGSMGAQKGALTIFCGGDPADVEHAIAIMAPYTKRAERVGPLGAGQTMKAANQIAVALALLGMCEALAFAEKSGLDIAQTRDLLSGGAAGSWAFDNYGPKVLARDWSPGFTVDNQVKDLAYCELAAQDAGAAVPGTELVHTLLKEMQANGQGWMTTAGIFQALLDRGGRT